MFNYRKELTIFNEKWDKLRKQYTAVDMSEDAIAELYEFDFELFRKRRNRINNTSDIALDQGLVNGVNVEQLLYTNKHYIDIEKDLFVGRYEWVEHIERIDLVDKLKKLSKDDLELLTLIVVDTYSQSDLSRKFGCNQSVFSRKLKRIKKLLE